MQPTVTPRQMEILQFIRDFRRANGYSPTMQEIGDHLRLTKVTVFEHVGALERKEVLRRGRKHTARSLQISPDFSFPDERPTLLPLVGRIAAGMPIEAIEDNQALDLEDLVGAATESTEERGFSFPPDSTDSPQPTASGELDRPDPPRPSSS